MDCTSTTLNGLNVAAEYPNAIATRLMDSPTRESHPSASEIATHSGTMVMLSSRIPTTDESVIMMRITIGSSRYFRPEKRSTTLDMMNFSTPLLSRMRNVPPISTMNTMIATPVSASDDPNTSIGAVNVFQSGRRKSSSRYVLFPRSSEAMIVPSASRRYSPRGTTCVSMPASSRIPTMTAKMYSTVFLFKCRPTSLREFADEFSADKRIPPIG